MTHRIDRLNFAVPTPALQPLRQWVLRADAAAERSRGLQEKPLDRVALAQCFDGLHHASAKYWLPSSGGGTCAGGGGRGGMEAEGSPLLPVTQLHSKL